MYITIKNNAKPLKELKELELLRKQEINEIKRTKKKVEFPKLWYKYYINIFRVWIKVCIA